MTRGGPVNRNQVEIISIPSLTTTGVSYNRMKLAGSSISGFSRATQPFVRFRRWSRCRFCEVYRDCPCGTQRPLFKNPLEDIIHMFQMIVQTEDLFDFLFAQMLSDLFIFQEKGLEFSSGVPDL